MNLAAPFLAPALLLAAVVGVYQVGKHQGDAAARQEAQAAQAVSLRRAIDQAAEIARQDAEILTTHEASAAGIRAVYRALTHEADLYALAHVNLDCELDADGVRLWTAANAGTLAAAPAAAQPYAALPGTGAARLGRADGTAGQPYRDGAGISVVPGETARLESMGVKPHWGW
jgi:hypothetical protein